MMEAVPSEPPVMAMDLSKSFSSPPRTRNCRAPASDLPAKPEWYRRCPAGSRVDSSYGTVNYNEDGAAEPGYVSAALRPGVYADGDLWCPALYSCEDDSDSGSDVIVLLAAAKEPLLCASFVANGVQRIMEPLSPAQSSPGCCRRTLGSPSSDTSSSEGDDDESESSADIPPHHARPLVLLADLGAGAADSRVDTSDDSDVLEVPVSQITRERSAFPPDKILEDPAPVKRSFRIRARSARVTPQHPARRHLARNAKKDAVGVYYESRDSDDALDYALESDDDAGESEKSESQDRSADKAEVDHSPCRIINQSDDSPLRREASESDDARQRRKTENDQVHRPKKPRLNKSSETRKSSTKRKLSTAAKKSAKRQRRKRRAWCPPPSLFSSPEPQLKLKCTAAQEASKKKKNTPDDFHPFVRVRRRAGSEDVTVINQRDQQDAPREKRQSAARSFCGVIPNTSCFRLGRIGDAGRAPPLCCLCGQRANADGLGDLHGPYLPAPSRSAKSPDAGEGDPAGRGPGERWVHSDCSVWSGKVFLVRGNLYGLEEAEQLARDTICCWCHQSDAIMGCSHKGCARSFHYTCALSSGCVLNEDNFSLRCAHHHRTASEQQHDGRTQRKRWRAALRHIR